MPGGGAALSGLRIVVTRPAHQARELVRALERDGAGVLSFPVLGIEAPAAGSAARARLARRPLADMIIFVSANAVEYGLRLAGDALGDVPLAAVGQATAGALAAAGLQVAMEPADRYDSEALLSLPQMAPVVVEGKHVLIFRGDGGREHLANTLRERGAQVEYLEVYRRVLPDTDPRPLHGALDRRAVDAIIVTSVAGLRNLAILAGESYQEQLRRVPLVVVSERLARAAREAGYRMEPVIAPRASSAALRDTVVEWWGSLHKQ